MLLRIIVLMRNAADVGSPYHTCVKVKGNTLQNDYEGELREKLVRISFSERIACNPLIFAYIAEWLNSFVIGDQNEISYFIRMTIEALNLCRRRYITNQLQNCHRDKHRTIELFHFILLRLSSTPYSQRPPPTYRST